MATVQLTNLGKSFGAFTALENLNLDIADGEFVVLLGPSGCGKSTTMRMVAGLEEPSTGEIRISGKKVNDVPARHRDLAMVFQNYALYPHMTVGENIAYPLKCQGVPRAERIEKVKAAAAKVEMQDLLKRRPGELSGGQRQRVALARAIIRTPRLFLMDEPLSNLDAKLRTVMRAELKHLQKDLATTTIYVTHDQTEAMTLADRIVILNEARIQQIGRPGEIYAKPGNLFVAGFIGSPPMNLIKGEARQGRFHFEGGTSIKSPVTDGAAIMGIRPEDISVAEPGRGNVSGEIYSAELLGDCTLVHLRSGGNLLAAKIAPRENLVMSAPLDFVIPEDRLHWFDPVSGYRKEV